MLTGRDFVVGGVAAILAVGVTLGVFALTSRGSGTKEKSMNSNDLADVEPVTLPSSHGVSQTVERFKELLEKKNIQLFAHIDHAAEAEKVGLSLRPTQVLIFGNPKAGTPLMQSQQTIGLDLPLRVLIWEDSEGKVWLTYRRVAELAQQHHLVGHDETVKALDDGLAALARAVTGP
jgi:uncharacterized protein (DUF302 family)